MRGSSTGATSTGAGSTAAPARPPPARVSAPARGWARAPVRASAVGAGSGSGVGSGSVVASGLGSHRARGRCLRLALAPREQLRRLEAGRCRTPAPGPARRSPWDSSRSCARLRCILPGGRRRRCLSVPPPRGATVEHRRQVVGVTGFEPAASSSRTTRATKLRHTPMCSGQPLGAARLTSTGAYRSASGRPAIGIEPLGVSAGRGSAASPRAGTRPGSGCTGWCPVRRRRGARRTRGRRAASRPGAGAGRAPARARGRSWW